MIGCLMIHGYTGGPYEIEPLKEYLQTHTEWEIIVPTLPGHGEELTLENVSYEEWLQTVEEIIQEMTQKYDKIYLVGFSMGGMIAAYLAANYEVHKLVLLACAGKFLTPVQWLINFTAIVKGTLQGGTPKNPLYQRYLKKAGTVPFHANLEFVRLVRYTRRYLKDVRTPVLIAHGQQDEVVPVRAADYLYEHIGSEQKEAVLFADSQHQICLGDDQATLNAMIYDFLVAD